MIQILGRPAPAPEKEPWTPVMRANVPGLPEL
jgi:hypothetical protein